MSEARRQQQTGGNGAIGATRRQIGLPGIRFSVLRWRPESGGPNARRLVILHGVTGNAISWDAVARDLADDGWTVEAPDLPGHGETRWTDDAGRPLADQESIGPAAYGLENMGRLVAGVLRALDERAAPAGERLDAVNAGGRDAPPAAPVVLAHSWGTGVAAAAVDAGAEMAELILLEPPVLSAEQAGDLAESFVSWLRPELDLTAAREQVRADGRDEDGVEAEARAMVETSPGAAAAIARSGPPNPLEFMASWRGAHPSLPVEVIAGEPEAGGLVPAFAVKVFAMALGAEHVHVLRGLGHSPNREDRGRFVELLRGLLGRVEPERHGPRE